MTSVLPQLERLFLADAGLESDMIFNHGFDLPCFASIMLLRSEKGRQSLERYFLEFIELAKRHGTGIVLESATWRASPDWAEPLGLTHYELDQLNRDAITIMIRLRDRQQTTTTPVVVSACIGPRGDGYDPGRIMSIADAEAYHAHQAAVLASAAPDMLSAMTINNVNEAIGIARAAKRTGLPLALSFTVETDGRLPTGDRLGDAITAVDEASGCYPAYYMVNCAHPTHFADVLLQCAEWVERVRGVRANASKCSHTELEAMTELDDGDPVELGEDYRRLLKQLPQVTVLGGCCGTDLRHIRVIAERCLGPAAVEGA